MGLLNTDNLTYFLKMVLKKLLNYCNINEIYG